MTNGPDLRASSGLGVLEAWRLITTPVPGRPATRYGGIALVLGLLNVGALAGAAAVTIPDPLWAVAAGLVHAALVPGMLLAVLLLPTDETDLAEWLTLACALGMAALVLSGLTLALLPLRLGPLTVVGWTATLSLALSAAAFRRGLRWTAPAWTDSAALKDAGAVALLAGLTRLPLLGYSEFQGDETEVVLRAAGVVQDLPDALFYHGKGPGEVVVVSTLYGLVGTLSEGAARLPFALAGVLGIVAVSLVARRLLGRPGALAAGLLLCLNGYFVAFSRIAQYQTLVLLLGTAALWCALRWSLGGRPIWPVLAGAFAATAALAHYDALFVLPPILALVFWRTGLRGLADRQVLFPWLLGAGVGLAALALFFGPYLTSPLFELATGRIGDRVGASFPRNNLPSIVAAGTLYLGTVYPVLVAALAALGAGVLVLRRAAAPGAGRALLLGLLWAAVPLAFYAGVARKPGTHVHVATTGLILVAAAGVAAAWAVSGRRRAGRLAVGALLGTGLLLAASYVVPVYLLTGDELVRQGRVGSLLLAWTPPGGLPTKERFGFPYQAGWKAAGVLFADGTLSGSYESNEQPQVTRWYTRGAWRCSAAPRYYLIAENVQDEIETPRRVIGAEYHPLGTVTVGSEPKLRVYERGPAAGAAPATWAAEELGARFDRRLSAPTLDPGPWARGVLARGSISVTARFGEAVELLGYQVYAEDPTPGGVVRVDLAWLPYVSSDEEHRIDVQLGREPRLGDGGGPACDKSRADQEWRAGQPFVQRVSIPIAAGAAPGRHPLLVGVSTLGPGGGPLPATGAGGDGPLVEIGEIEVRDGGRAAR